MAATFEKTPMHRQSKEGELTYKKSSSMILIEPVKTPYNLACLGKLLSTMFKNRELIWQMAIRDLKGTHKGAFLGYLWLILSPFIQVTTYVIIVSFVFKRRISEEANTFDYALYILSGMIPWQIITKSLQEAPSLIRERMELVKQVIYPIETLPLTHLMVSSFGSFVSFLIYFMLTILTGNIYWSYILLPIPFLMLITLILGVSWLFAIVGVLFKDLREIVSVILSLLIYLSPVIVNESMVGEKIWRYILLNPLSHIVICFRDVFYATFHMWSWIIFIGMSLFAFLIGGFVITRTKLLINEYI